ncbi:MAG: phosphatidylglycerol:prolipoprotein diacylglycerol transferase [Marivirga sp.]|jgi:phosphatidylglycerol:prolipoprotein diacylglycerol transferase
MLDYIVWDPSGTIVDLGFYQLRWYSVLFGFGFVLGYQFVKGRFKKASYDVALLDSLAVYLVIGTIIGARFVHCVFYDWDYFSHHLLEIFLPFRFSPEFEFTGFLGLASHGGGLGVLVAVLIFAKRHKVNTVWLIDTIAFVIPLAGASIRLGNLMNSEIVGRLTDVPWAFVFTHVDGMPRHPAQLYEALSYLAIFGFLYWLKSQKFHRDGLLVSFMLLLVFTARFLIEFVKANQVNFENQMVLNMGQWLSIPFILIGGLLIFLLLRKSPMNSPTTVD